MFVACRLPYPVRYAGDVNKSAIACDALTSELQLGASNCSYVPDSASFAKASRRRLLQQDSSNDQGVLTTKMKLIKPAGQNITSFARDVYTKIISNPAGLQVSRSAALHACAVPGCAPVLLIWWQDK